MLWLGEVWRRLTFFFRRGQFQRELKEEMDEHVRMKQKDLTAEGMPPDEARDASRREFGNALLLREKSRDAWGFGWLETLLQDLRYGLRQLRRNPGFTAVAVMTLALGIGATTAMFSVIECSVLKPFPYAHSHRMAVVVARYRYASSDYYWGWFPPKEFLDFRAHSNVFEQMIGTRQENWVFRGRGEALDFACLETTGNFFQFTGVRPFLGRTFTPADAAPGAPPVAVLRYTTWQSKFGGDPKIVGRTINLNGKPVSIIGVMPPRFDLQVADFWVPHDFATETAAESREMVSMMGLLKPGVSVQQAAAEIQVLDRHWAALHPKDAATGWYKDERLSVESLLTVTVGPKARKILYMLFAAVGLLLAIACGNVANLQLARATTREGEIGILAALGAGRARLGRQFLAESLLFAAGGGLFGCLFAWPGLKALIAIIPPGDIPNTAAIRINGPVLLFATGIAIVATVLFGLAPALFAARKDFQTSLNAAVRAAQIGRRQPLLRNLLVIGEFGLSLILLTGAGLLMRSFIAVRYERLGYDPSHVLFADSYLPATRYKTAEQRNLFDTELLDRLRIMHGVVSAAFSLPPLPYSGNWAAISVVGRSSAGSTTAQMRLISAGFLATMRIPLIKGRDISAEDVHAARKVAVVNKAFVRRYLRGRDPIGREVTIPALSMAFSIKSPTFQVIGVAGDIRNDGAGRPSQPSIYIAQTVVGLDYGTFLIRTTGAPGLLLNPLRRLVAGMDSQLPVEGEPVPAILNRIWYTEPRFVMTLMSVFSGLGLALVLIGIYSVLSYSVARRTHEIGIRLALGAQKGDVLRMVIWQGVKLGVIGVAAGIVGALTITRFLSSMLYGVKATDPVTFVAVSLLLIGVALLACWIPARRAANVDPMVALRYE